DDPGGPVPGSQPAQVGEPLLSHDDVYVVLGMGDVADHRDDRRDGTTLGRRGRQEEAAECVAREVPAAADAVHDRAAHDVGGVHVAVDVGLDHAVHGQHPETAHQLRMVGDLLTAQQDAALVAVDAGHEPAYAVAGQPER